MTDCMLAYSNAKKAGRQRMFDLLLGSIDLEQLAYAHTFIAGQP